jgi:hypothetical protein
MVETIGVSQFACQHFTEAGILGELITTPLFENGIGGASGQGTSKLRPKYPCSLVFSGSTTCNFENGRQNRCK